MFELKDNKIIYKENGIEVGFIKFIYLDFQTVDIVETFVDSRYRGKKVAKRLVEYALQYFESRKITVIYNCSYVKQYKKDIF